MFTAHLTVTPVARHRPGRLVIQVLVVDDDFMVARIHSGFVERTEGFEVVGSRHTGAEALAAVAELQPDLVLLDLYLPDLFGLDVLARLRSSRADCDVMVISAAKEVEAVRGAVPAGRRRLPPQAVRLRRAPRAPRAVCRAARHLLREAEVHGQDDIDRVLARRSPSGRAGAAAQGHERRDRRRWSRRALRESGETLSATECAEAVGISRVSARRYLEHFCSTGQAEVRAALRHHRPAGAPLPLVSLALAGPRARLVTGPPCRRGSRA